MWYTFAVQLLLLVATAVLILLEHIDIQFEARLSIEVNSRQTLLCYLSVFNINELQ